MRSPLIVLAVLAAVFGLSGCREEVVIKVNANGSGTLEKMVFYTNEEMKRTVDMQAGPLKGSTPDSASPDIDPKPPEVEVYDPELLEEDAKAMGSDVKLISAKHIENEKGQGFKAVFAFSDISQLRLDRMPEHHEVAKGKVRVYGGSTEPVRFQFAKGPPAELVLKFDRPAPEPPKEKKDEQAENWDKAFREALKGTRVSYSVEVHGKILETNAAFREGSRIILEDVDCDKILALPKEKIDAITDYSPAGLRKLGLSPEEGMRIEIGPEVLIKFQ